MAYPGRIVEAGESDANLVRAVVQRLAAWGYRSTSPDGVFDGALASVVKLFQSQHADLARRPLKADGIIGPLTWGALFLEPSAGASGALIGATLARARSKVGVMEHPPGSNRGPDVEAFLRSVGLDPGEPWCMAFVSWCFQRGAEDAGIADPFPKLGGCLDVWDNVAAHSPARIVTADKARADPSIVRQGHIFILDHGHGHGHTGFVTSVAGGALGTIEGNSNNNGSAEGVGVFALNRRSVMETDLRGFLDFNN